MSISPVLTDEENFVFTVVHDALRDAIDEGPIIAKVEREWPKYTPWLRAYISAEVRESRKCGPWQRVAQLSTSDYCPMTQAMQA